MLTPEQQDALGNAIDTALAGVKFDPDTQVLAEIISLHVKAGLVATIKTLDALGLIHEVPDA